MRIYYNLGQSGKAIGTKLLLLWTLKDRDVLYMEEKAVQLERLVNKIWKPLLNTCCRRVLCNFRE